MALPTSKIEFLGDGLEPRTELDVAYIAEFARAADGQCAYCLGDPCAERSAPDSRIARFMAQSWAETCPNCSGRPS
jgi:hypothetical protein